MDGILTLIIAVYVLCHTPAIAMVVVGLMRLKSKPENAKKLLIAAVIYFIIGAGIFGAFLS